MLRLSEMARTWYFEKEVVGDRVAGPSFLENDIGQEVVVINGNGSVIVHDERRPLVGDLVHAVDLVAWRQGKGPDLVKTDGNGEKRVPSRGMNATLLNS